jgi:hypothetical protein
MMLRTGMLLLLFAATGAVVAAPIPKALKKKQNNLDFEGYWEQTGSNSNGKDGGITHGKYWKVESDKFYYSLAAPEAPQGSSKGALTTPDESKPNIKDYSNSRCRLEINDDVLSWVFANDKGDPLEDCAPGPRRIIYYFKRVEK